MKETKTVPKREEREALPEMEAMSGAISRRKLLASIGMTGAAVAAGAIFNNGLGFAQGNAVADSVYGRTQGGSNNENGNGNGNGHGNGNIRNVVAEMIGESCVVLTTIAELRGLAASPGPESIYYVTDPGKEGHFAFVPSDTVSPDDGGMVLVSAAGGRFKRIFSGQVNVQWFGAKGDGATDDTAAIQSAIKYVSSEKTHPEYPEYPYTTGVVFFPRGNYKIAGTVYVTTHIWLNGEEAVWIGNGNNANSNTLLESAVIGANGLFTSNFATPGNDQTNRLVNTKIKGITFTECALALKLRGFNEQCEVADCRFFNCWQNAYCKSPFYSVWNRIVSRNRYWTFEQPDDGTWSKLPAFHMDGAANAMDIRDVNVASSYFAWKFSDQSGVQPSGATQFVRCGVEVCFYGIVIEGTFYNLSISNCYGEVVDTFLKSDDAVKYGLLIDDNYFYGVDHVVDVSGLRDSFIGRRNQVHSNSVNGRFRGKYNLRKGLYGNTCDLEIDKDAEPTDLSRYAVSGGGVRSAGYQTIWNTAKYVVHDKDAVDGIIPLVYKGDCGGYVEHKVVGSQNMQINRTSGNEVYAVTDFTYNPYLCLAYTVTVTPNAWSGPGGTTPPPIRLAGIALGDLCVDKNPTHAAYVDEIDGNAAIHFTGFGTDNTDPNYAWMRNGQFASEGIIRMM